MVFGEDFCDERSGGVACGLRYFVYMDEGFFGSGDRLLGFGELMLACFGKNHFVDFDPNPVTFVVGVLMLTVIHEPSVQKMALFVQAAVGPKCFVSAGSVGAVFLDYTVGSVLCRIDGHR